MDVLIKHLDILNVTISINRDGAATVEHHFLGVSVVSKLAVRLYGKGNRLSLSAMSI